MSESDGVTLTPSGDMTVGGDVVGRDAVGRESALFQQIFDSPDSQLTQDLWDIFVRRFGSYQSFAMFLFLPSDHAAIQYLSQFGKELDQISNENCLVFAIGQASATLYGEHHEASQSSQHTFNQTNWQQAMQDQLESGWSVKLAKHLNIRFDEFPCMVIFPQLKLRSFSMIPLRDMSTDQIASVMRTMFSDVQNAVTTGADLGEAIRQIAAKSRESVARASSEKLTIEAPARSSTNLTTAGDANVGGDLAGRDIVKNFVTQGVPVRSFGIIIAIALGLLGLIALIALLLR